MKVSVSILAYNHEKFIAKSIESAINQKVDFEYEILIGEDQSSDNTREIVREYESKYPDLIKVAYNDYPPDYKRSYAWDNFYQNFKRAKGEYVAYMDGDDYWIDPFKLQKQADCMDENQHCILSHHDAEYRALDGSLARTRHPDGTKREIDAFDLISENNIVMSSCMYRNIFDGKFPSYMKSVKTIDRYFNIFHLIHGKGYYIDEIMAVYRYDSGGIQNGLSKIQRTKNRIQDMSLLLSDIPSEYHPAVKQQIKSLKMRLLKQQAKNILNIK